MKQCHNANDVNEDELKRHKGYLSEFWYVLYVALELVIISIIGTVPCTILEIAGK